MQKDDWTPTLEQLQAEQKRLNHRKKYRRALAGTIGILVVVAALSVLVSTVFLPVFLPVRIFPQTELPMQFPHRHPFRSLL